MLTDGRKVTKELFRRVLDEELGKIKRGFGEERYAKGKYETARELFHALTTEDTFVEFLTLPGYERLG